MAVRIARTLPELRSIIAGWRRQGEAVGLVPTMGALHDGHLSLVRLARTQAQRTVVSIFVNPTQFAPHEDFSRYPRDEAGDLEKLNTVACDLVWMPPLEVMYPTGFATRLQPAGPAEGLETDFRPHFFGGVATVCCKLFNQVQCDVAAFGEKDYQQLAVVTRMVADLDLPMRILPGETVREADGLAMSSRNKYLSADERRIAPAMNAAISKAAQRIAAGDAIAAIEADMQAHLLAAGFERVDYATVRDAVSLRPIETRGDRRLRVLAAAWLGRTRLIDNVAA